MLLLHSWRCTCIISSASGAQQAVRAIGVLHAAGGANPTAAVICVGMQPNQHLVGSKCRLVTGLQLCSTDSTCGWASVQLLTGVHQPHMCFLWNLSPSFLCLPCLVCRRSASSMLRADAFTSLILAGRHMGFDLSRCTAAANVHWTRALLAHARCGRSADSAAVVPPLFACRYILWYFFSLHGWRVGGAGHGRCHGVWPALPPLCADMVYGVGTAPCTAGRCTGQGR